MTLIDRFIKPAYAHCDIPCGIYETDTMRHAADTCLRMATKIADEQSEGMEAAHAVARYTLVKEEHARKCKHELYVLWSDYFKPEHLSAFPELHDTFWQTVKQVSKVKQTASVEEAEKLVEMTGRIADMFAKSQKAA